MAAATQTWNQQDGLALKRILIATDFSEISRLALRYALSLANQYSSEFYVVHATPQQARGPFPREFFLKDLARQQFNADQQMKQFVKAGALGDTTHHELLEQGPVADVLSSVIKREQIDVLVLGTHGRGGLKKLMLGSVAEEMLRLVSCPVLSVGQQVCPEAGACRFERILFATDFGAGAAKALHFAVGLAEKYAAKLSLIHIIPSLESRLDTTPAAYGPSVCLADDLLKWEAKQRHECRAKLQQMISPAAKLAHEPEYVLGLDAPVEGILGAAAERKVELIVMGANRTHSAGAAAHLPWAVAHRVICEAECPVLTVRG